jgi:hypothetical protein
MERTKDKAKMSSMRQRNCRAFWAISTNTPADEIKREFDNEYIDLMLKGLMEPSHYYHSQKLYCLDRLGIFETMGNKMGNSGSVSV